MTLAAAVRMPDHLLTLHAAGQGRKSGLCACGWLSGKAATSADAVTAAYQAHVDEARLIAAATCDVCLCRQASVLNGCVFLCSECALDELERSARDSRPPSGPRGARDRSASATAGTLSFPPLSSAVTVASAERVLCAHADRNGEGMHWTTVGEAGSA